MENVHRIDLGRGRHAVVDADDAELVAVFHWCINGNGYVHGYRSQYTYHSQRLVLLHRIVLGIRTAEHVDHRNGDKLDNRRCNLRVATPTQNQANSGSRRGSSSRHKGVLWDASRQRWAAFIKVEGRSRFLGRFEQENDAARAYNEAATAVWGNFARLNEVDDLSG